jgi:hypothetical protein
MAAKLRGEELPYYSTDIERSPGHQASIRNSLNLAKSTQDKESL